jgi:hypothetical protein
MTAGGNNMVAKPKDKAKPIGRPPKPPALKHAKAMDEIIDWISEGKTLRDFCRQPGQVTFGAVYGWLDKDAAFAERFARARDTGHDIIAQECLEIADRKAEDYMVLADGREQLDREHVQRSKLRIETRLKLLAKWNPKKYGDRLQVAGDAENPLAIQQITRKVVE